MRRALVACIAAVLAGVAAHTQSQPPRPATASAVCDVTVLDANGSPISNLRQGDFEVVVDGELTRLTGLVTAPSAVSVVLIVDASSSQPLKRYEMNSALATLWLPSLRLDDRARVGVLASPLTLTTWLPADPRTAAVTTKALIDRAPLEPSPLWDAAAAGIDALAGESNVKLVLIMSDGRSNANVIGLDEVVDRAIAAGVAVSSVGEGGERLLFQAGAEATTIRSDASLQWLADRTGGVYLPDGVARRAIVPRQDPFAYVRELIATPSKPGPLLVALTSALRQRYRLSFAAPADGRPHRLEVRVNNSGATVHVKKKFLAVR